jgi:hypothetical protein
MSARTHTVSPTTGPRLAELLMSAAAELAEAPRADLAPMGTPVRDGRLSLGRLRELLPRDETLEVVAGFAAACWIGPPVAVALVCGYWAAGGSFGVSRVLPDVPWGLQASRVVGAVTAAVGLLGLAGRWGQRTRFWLPAALTWVGSGAVAAFDGLALVALLLLGTDASAPGWSLTDTVLVIKAVIGMLAGAVGALAVTAATKDNHLQRALPERVEVRPVEVSAAGSRRTAARSDPDVAGQVLLDHRQQVRRARHSAATGVGLRRAGERPAVR